AIPIPGCRTELATYASVEIYRPSPWWQSADKPRPVWGQPSHGAARNERGTGHFWLPHQGLSEPEQGGTTHDCGSDRLKPIRHPGHSCLQFVPAAAHRPADTGLLHP